jgi:hypothetical protein
MHIVTAKEASQSSSYSAKWYIAINYVTVQNLLLFVRATWQVN